MNRFFGAKKVGPDLNTVLAGAEERILALEKKIKEIDEKLGQVKIQLNKSSHASVKQTLQSKAKRLLMERKMLSTQLEQQGGIAMNLGQVQLSTSSIEASLASISALKASAKAMQVSQRSLKLDDVERLQDKMADLLEFNTEVQNSLGSTYDVPEIDDQELEAELAMLQEEVGQEVGDLELPSLPELELKHRPQGEREKEGVV